MKTTTNAATPWASEPDAMDFTDEKTGLRCALRRGPLGHWCGYVGLPTGHPWHGKEYYSMVRVEPEHYERHPTKVADVGVFNALCFDPKHAEAGVSSINMIVRCHGGLTYAGRGEHMDLDGTLWWLGFDCAHAGDWSPKMGQSPGDVYRTIDYVADQCRRAAADIAAFSKWEG